MEKSGFFYMSTDISQSIAWRSIPAGTGSVFSVGVFNFFVWHSYWLHLFYWPRMSSLQDGMQAASAGCRTAQCPR